MLALLLLKKVGNDSHSSLTHIAQMRINKGFSISDICRMTGLSYDNYIKYEKETVDEQYANIESLRKISNILGVDLLTDYQKFKEYSSQIVKEYMDNNNLSIRKFAKIADVSITTVKNWRNGICSPSLKCWERFFKEK